MAAMERRAYEEAHRPGRPAGFSCPDCHGSLFETDAGGPLRFRCRVGHAWSSLALMAAQGDEFDGALWMAFRSLEEKTALSRQLADRAGERGNMLSRERYLERAAEADHAATLVQQLLNRPLSTLSVEDDLIEEENAEHG
jgi:two-component system chemotaxis response regulator CheB